MHRIEDGRGSNPNQVYRNSQSEWDAARNIKESSIIFTCSMSDFFIEEADQWRDEAWNVIRETPQHHWVILTKRPERIKESLPSDWGEEGYANVWLGVSVADESEIHRVDTLNALKSDKSKFLTVVSVEPLVGEIDFINKTQSFAKTDWVIIGGESGNEYGKYKYRPCKLSWIRSVIGQCYYLGVPVFLKQLGTHLAKELKMTDWKKGEDDFDEWDNTYKVREYPKSYKGPKTY